MKILSKINRQFIVLSFLVLAVLIVPLYFIMLAIQENEISENLRASETWVYHSIRDGKDIPRVYPVIEVTTCETLRNPAFRDTLIMDPVENDLELFNEYSTVREVRGKLYQITVRTYGPEKSNLAILLFSVFLAVLVILNTILILINRHVSRKVWLQFREILATIRNFSLRKLEPVKPVDTDVTEFRELNAEMKKLTGRIIRDYDNVRQFSENAAHEMQTPLMIIRNRVDALLSTPGLTDEQTRLTSAIEEGIDRLNRLNKGLLLLARIENGQYPVEGNIAVDQVLRTVAGDFEEIAGMKSIRLEWKIDADKHLDMNPELAQVLFSNLLGNALKYTPENGKILITLSDREIRISNHGHAPLSGGEQLFERFYRENPAGNSTGLGLAIAKAVCETAGMEISYEFSNGMHHFILGF